MLSVVLFKSIKVCPKTRCQGSVFRTVGPLWFAILTFDIFLHGTIFIKFELDNNFGYYTCTYICVLNVKLP